MSDATAFARRRPARRLLRADRGGRPAAPRGRAAAARRRRPQLRAVPASGPSRRLADGQPPHDRPGRRRRLQPQRPDLPGGPAREGGTGHARSRPRTTSAASRSRSPTRAARCSRRCSPATSRSSARCSSTRSRRRRQEARRAARAGARPHALHSAPLGRTPSSPPRLTVSCQGHLRPTGKAWRLATPASACLRHSRRLPVAGPAVARGECRSRYSPAASSASANCEAAWATAA